MTSSNNDSYARKDSKQPRQELLSSSTAGRRRTSSVSDSFTEVGGLQFPLTYFKPLSSTNSNSQQPSPSRSLLKGSNRHQRRNSSNPQTDENLQYEDSLAISHAIDSSKHCTLGSPPYDNNSKALRPATSSGQHLPPSHHRRVSTESYSSYPVPTTTTASYSITQPALKKKTSLLTRLDTPTVITTSNSSVSNYYPTISTTGQSNNSLYSSLKQRTLCQNSNDCTLATATATAVCTPSYNQVSIDQSNTLIASTYKPLSEIKHNTRPPIPPPTPLFSLNNTAYSSLKPSSPHTASGGGNSSTLQRRKSSTDTQYMAENHYQRVRDFNHSVLLAKQKRLYSDHSMANSQTESFQEEYNDHQFDTQIQPSHNDDNDYYSYLQQQQQSLQQGTPHDRSLSYVNNFTQHQQQPTQEFSSQQGYQHQLYSHQKQHNIQDDLQSLNVSINYSLNNPTNTYLPRQTSNSHHGSSYYHSHYQSNNNNSIEKDPFNADSSVSHLQNHDRYFSNNHFQHPNYQPINHYQHQNQQQQQQQQSQQQQSQSQWQAISSNLSSSSQNQQQQSPFRDNPYQYQQQQQQQHRSEAQLQSSDQQTQYDSSINSQRMESPSHIEVIQYYGNSNKTNDSPQLEKGQSQLQRLPTATPPLSISVATDNNNKSKNRSINQSPFVEQSQSNHKSLSLPPDELQFTQPARHVSTLYDDVHDVPTLITLPQHNQETSVLDSQFSVDKQPFQQPSPIIHHNINGTPSSYFPRPTGCFPTKTASVYQPLFVSSPAIIRNSDLSSVTHTAILRGGIVASPQKSPANSVRNEKQHENDTLYQSKFATAQINLTSAAAVKISNECNYKKSVVSAFDQTNNSFEASSMVSPGVHQRQMSSTHSPQIVVPQLNNPAFNTMQTQSSSQGSVPVAAHLMTTQPSSTKHRINNLNITITTNLARPMKIKSKTQQPLVAEGDYKSLQQGKKIFKTEEFSSSPLQQESQDSQKLHQGNGNDKQTNLNISVDGQQHHLLIRPSVNQFTTPKQSVEESCRRLSEQKYRQQTSSAPKQQPQQHTEKSSSDSINQDRLTSQAVNSAVATNKLMKSTHLSDSPSPSLRIVVEDSQLRKKQINLSLPSKERRSTSNHLKTSSGSCSRSNILNSEAIGVELSFQKQLNTQLRRNADELQRRVSVLDKEISTLNRGSVTVSKAEVHIQLKSIAEGMREQHNLRKTASESSKQLLLQEKMLSVVQRKDQTNLVKEYRRLSLEHTRTVSQERFYRKLYEEKTNTEGLEREIALLQGRENGLKINLSSIIAAHNQILQSAMEPAVDCR